jgi:hypothetical protein
MACTPARPPPLKRCPSRKQGTAWRPRLRRRSRASRANKQRPQLRPPRRWRALRGMRCSPAAFARARGCMSPQHTRNSLRAPWRQEHCQSNQPSRAYTRRRRRGQPRRTRSPQGRERKRSPAPRCSRSPAGRAGTWPAWWRPQRKKRCPKRRAGKKMEWTLRKPRCTIQRHMRCMKRRHRRSRSPRGKPCTQMLSGLHNAPRRTRRRTRRSPPSSFGLRDRARKRQRWRRPRRQRSAPPRITHNPWRR